MLGRKSVTKELIAMVKERPCIWDTRLPYPPTDSQLKEAWDEISRKLGAEPGKCVARWNDIKSLFARNVRGSLPTLGLEEELSFLVPHVKIQANSPSFKVKHQTNEEVGAKIYVSTENLSPIRDSIESDLLEISDVIIKREPNDDSENECLAENCEMGTVQDINISDERSTVKFGNDSMPGQSKLQKSPANEDNDPLSKLKMKTLILKINRMPETELIASPKRIESNDTTAMESTDSIDTRPSCSMNKRQINVSKKIELPNKIGNKCNSLSKKLQIYGDNSFLISLLPYLNQMTNKQNRVFKQKVIKLIDKILENHVLSSDNDES